MDNEIIILSSDEEKEDNIPKQTVLNNKTTSTNNDLDFFKKALSNYPCSSGSTENKYPPYKFQLICNSKSKDKIEVKEAANKKPDRTSDSSPELVDLVEVSPKKIHKPLPNGAVQKEAQNTSEVKSTVSSTNGNSDKLTANATLQNSENKSNIPDTDKSAIYDEFVSKCGSLEKIEEDRERLVKKLYKYYSKCNQEYVKSEEFLQIVEKNMKKLNEKNLYLIAKEVTDELCLQREVEIRKTWFGQGKHSSESDNDKNNKLNLKQSKVINRILYKLTKLHKKIQELEEAEVDLSDEEDSVYVRLQSYRNKFCQIYKRLCKYTNQLADANRMYSRNISFTGSPYTDINQCIEKWLNKTKRFPDFKDILKLIESQSSSLGLSSDRESMRDIAKEIFHKVGVQLKERRKYDLWDSFCGYLKDSEDPAKNDPELEKILNNNALIAVKKEQEVIKHYAQIQEKEKLEPEEISDGEANRSPDDSGNEDENEIEAIETSIDQKLYNDIDRELQDNLIQIDDDDDQADTTQQKQEEEEKEESLKLRESKNGFKNCKSLKWRKLNSINRSNSDKDIGPSNSSTNGEETHCDTDESVSNGKSFNCKKTTYKSPLIDYTKNPVIQLKRLPQNVIEAYCKRKEETVDTVKKIINPYFVPSQEVEVPAKKPRTTISNPEVLDFDNLKKKKYESSNFTVRHCHIEHSFQNILNTLGYFDDFLSGQKTFKSRKIFRDLTNTNKLFHSNGTRKRTGYMSFPTIYKCSIDSVREPLWKKRFKVYNSFSNSNAKEQRCALSHEEKTQTTVKGGGGTNKDFQNNSGSGERGNCNFRSDRGSGSERDNNENDENKRNYKTEDDDPDENIYEDEEEKDDENEDEEEEEEESGRFKTNSEEKVSDEENQRTELNRETLNFESDDKNEENGMEKCEDVCNENSTMRIEEESEGVEEIEEKAKIAEEENVENTEESDCAEDNTLEQNSTRDEENNGEGSVDEEKNEDYNTNEIDETVAGDKSEYDSEVAEENIVENKEDCKTQENEYEEETLREKEADGNEVKLEISSKNLITAEENREKTDVKTNVGVKNESGVQTKRRRKSRATPNVNTSMGNLRESTEENERVTRLTRNKNRVKKTETKNERFNYNNNIGSNNYEALITAEATIGEQVVQAQVTLEEQSSNCHRITNSRRSRRPPENFFSKNLDVETLRQSLCKRKSTNPAPSPSDEERVKRFLLHSPSSISITPPKKLSMSKPPSQAALQALATLRNLKGISTTRVRTKPKTEDDVVVLGESSKRGAASSTQSAKKSANGMKTPKRKTNSFPLITDIHSMLSVTPKIVEIQGSVSGFESAPQKKGNRNKNRKSSSNSNSRSSSGSGGTSSSIKISNVWGALPNSFIQSTATPQNKAIPSCSYPQARTSTTNKATNKKKNSKKVEYVELD